MKMKIALSLLLLCFISKMHAQYSFSGYVDNERWQSDVFLSYIEDFRKIDGVYTDQIISRVKVDSTGFFKFSGNQLESSNRIYRIHVDNCNTEETGIHFNGHCEDSKELVFLAKNTDTIHFPESFDSQMFCEIKSTNEHSDAFIRVDSIKELMRFAYTDYKSETNSQLNHKKWFKTLKDFGKKLNEPLANLYIYEFLSDRGNITYDYYIKNLNEDDFYKELANNLEQQYPNTVYASQYKAEFDADSYIESSNSRSKSFPKWILLGVGLLLLLNAFLVFKFLLKKKSSKKSLVYKLTKQETVILDLIRQNKSNKEIAEINFISLSTVKSHISNIYKKLEVNSRDEIKSLF